ncbi:MAG: ribonuclease HII [Marinoscillum sp.]|jgi:ribonuclease HII
MLEAFFKKGIIEAGCDEAGRGCLAGPVVAASVILPHDYHHKILNDSKQLSEKQRERLEPEIMHDAIAYGIGVVEALEIDQINILNASFLAMHRAVDLLATTPGFLLIDGNRFNPYPEIQHECIIKGDGKYLSIAAASVLAKTYRDRLMKNFAEQYPGYGWQTNAGYPTKAHRQAIRELGTTPLHRMTFQLLPRQLELFDK